jgi:hypothetical protein
MEGDGLHKPIALVEHPDHGDPLGHRGHSSLAPGEHLAGVRGLLLLLVRSLRTAGGKRQRKQESAVTEHVYSGVQGW